MNQRLQFRVLYRQFLFRLMDVELLSASARGDASGLLSQFAALLIFGSLLQAYLAIPLGEEIRSQASAAAMWPVERGLISVTMLVVGLFALLSWESTFPDRRDILLLGPLPVRAHTLFAAKIAAIGSALGLTVVAWNSLAAFAWPVALAPDGFGFLPTLQFILAFWVVLLAAGAFLYSAVLGVQALSAQLPRSWYLRVSSALQMAAFILFLGVVFFEPSFNTSAELAAPKHVAALAWLPPYWFLGLLSELSGVFPAEQPGVMALLARRALIGLTAAILIAGGGFLLSYLRTMRKIVEEPDIVPGTRGGVWLPRFGSLPQTAVAQFVIRTLVRSRRHRVIFAFYSGGGFALLAVYLGGAQEMLRVSGLDLIRRVNAPILAASILLLCACWLGTRTVFSLPQDLRSNSVFRLTPALGCADSLPAARRALLTLAVLPVFAVTATLLFWFWPWRTAAEHLLLLGLLGSVLADASLRGFRKIPFTCSYLPGKSKVHMVFWFGIIPLVMLIHQAAALEQRAMDSARGFWLIAAILAAAAFLFRRFTNTSVDRNAPELQFEESAPDDLIALDLNR